MNLNDYFFIDHSSKHTVTWDELISDLNGINSFNKIINADDYYGIFKNIILGILNEVNITLLDFEYTANEIYRLTGYENHEQRKNHIHIIGADDTKIIIANKADLISRLNDKSNTNVTIYTSGTTGIPKSVTHSLNTLTRNVRIGENFSHSIWGFAYNPTHIAGIQVFLQALFNGNTIVRVFGLETREAAYCINEYCVTHISATPTFYRLLIAEGNTYKSVIRVSSGGEKLDEMLLMKLKSSFPNASIKNIYASTEGGTLLEANGNSFSIPEKLKHFIKLENNEIVIHKSLMGENDFISSEWYHTGDMVEVIAENEFIIVGRENQMINVGGYKVNPAEIEEMINKLDGIGGVRVYSKKNSVIGNIICCDIVRLNLEINEAFIRTKLAQVLQEYKIPRIVNFVNIIETTRTGKTIRR